MLRFTDNSLPRDPVQRLLLDRQIRQILERPDEQGQAMTHLAVRCFMPFNRSLTFDSPLQKLGSVVLVVLSRHSITARSGQEVERLYLRGYTACIDPATGNTHWEPGSSCFAFDLNRPMRPRASGHSLSLENTTLARLALDMDREIARQCHRSFALPDLPMLPPTLLAFPRDTKFRPEMTTMVLAKARKERIDWQEAWKGLYRQLRVPDRSSHILVDTRICTRVRPGPGWCGSLGEYHDLRGLLDRAIFNPTRDRPIPRGLSNQRIVEVMRGRLPRDLAEVARDQDLLLAAHNPRLPLIVQGLSRMQVWRPPQDALCPESFQFKREGHMADLWHVRPAWMGFLRSHASDAPEDVPAIPALACA